MFEKKIYIYRGERARERFIFISKHPPFEITLRRMAGVVCCCDTATTTTSTSAAAATYLRVLFFIPPFLFFLRSHIYIYIFVSLFVWLADLHATFEFRNIMKWMAFSLNNMYIHMSVYTVQRQMDVLENPHYTFDYNFLHFFSFSFSSSSSTPFTIYCMVERSAIFFVCFCLQSLSPSFPLPSSFSRLNSCCY